MFPNMFPLASGPLGAIPVMSVQAMIQQATRHARRVYVRGLPPTANEQEIAFRSFTAEISNLYSAKMFTNKYKQPEKTSTPTITPESHSMKAKKLYGRSFSKKEEEEETI
ncbi:hypothetical protein RND71_036480 [Anisodus tanguticus]|uniref:Uncharacterized protein n=1 Tax=Anisodus tanguticus TaxID=243964 RepID=A0AAE1R1S1_9SOLA|nr:hypothetical protein RND71_036480 [Anisodus tanguticus]